MQALTAQLHITYRKTVISIAVLLVLLVGSYIFLVNQTIQNVVGRKHFEVATEILSSPVSELEFSYIRHQNNITPEYAAQEGFFEAQLVTYVPRTPLGTVLSLNR